MAYEKGERRTLPEKTGKGKPERRGKKDLKERTRNFERRKQKMRKERKEEMETYFVQHICQRVLKHITLGPRGQVDVQVQSCWLFLL